MTDLADLSVDIVKADEAEEKGYAKCNSGKHLLVEVPDGHFTISARTSAGDLITFAFVPHEVAGPPRCVDIHHTPPDWIPNSPMEFPGQSVIVFGQGPTFYSSAAAGHHATLTTITF